MVRRKRDFAIFVWRCALVGYGASAQQAARGTEMVISSRPAVEVIQGAASSNVSPQPLSMRLPADNHDPPAPLILAQMDPVAPASQATGSNSGEGQETKNANVPAEPQAVMQEIKSATRPSGSKQRRRKPKMAGVPAGLQAVAQETPSEKEASETQAAPLAGAQEAPSEKEISETQAAPLAGAQETPSPGVLAKPQTGLGEISVKKVVKKYGMAPVRWGGLISETVGYERISQTFHGVAGSNNGQLSGESSGIFNTLTADVKATTYIMQPYIAQLGGNVGALSKKNINDISHVSNINGAQSIMSPHSGSNELSGDGFLKLFPQSRFPFSMKLGVGAKRANDEFDTQDTVSNYLSLQQAYRPLGSNSRYSISHDRDTQITRAAAGTNQSGAMHRTSWDGSYSSNTQENTNYVSIKYKDKAVSSVDNSTRRTDNFMVNNTYLPTDSLLTLQSIANLNWFSHDLDRTRYMLANTHAAWQPENENLPLFVDGGLYLLNEWISRPLEATSTQNIGGNAGATYNYSKNLTGRVDGSVARTRNINGRVLTMKQQGIATYRSDVTRLWKNTSYSWQANGGVGNTNTINHTQIRQLGGGADSRILGGIGHNLSVPYLLEMFGKKWPTNSNFNQQLDTQRSTVSGQSVAFTNSGSVRVTPGAFFGSSSELMGEYGRTDGLKTSAIFTVTDRRVYGKAPSHKRTYALSLNEGSRATYSRKGLEFDAALGAEQGTQGTAIYGSGIATYKNVRVFDVKGLAYKGTFKVSRRSSNIDRVADVNANDPKFPWELDQALTYRIGQNEVMLRSRISDQNGMKNASLWLLFRAWRTFGDY